MGALALAFVILGLLAAGRIVVRGEAESAAPFASDQARVFGLSNSRLVAVDDSRDDVVVRWRDARGDWGPARVVVESQNRVVTESRIRVAGDTLALFATYSPPETTYSDDISTAQLTADDVTIFAVCRDGACVTSREYAGTQEAPPQVTPDGRGVWFAQRDNRYVVWRSDQGDLTSTTVTEARISGLPRALEQTAPLLAPDGSLRVVQGEPGRNGCSYTLFTTEVGAATYESAIAYRDRSDRRRTCAVSLESFSSDYVVVRRAPYRETYLARQAGGDWARVAEDPSGALHFPRVRSRSLAVRLPGSYAVSGYWHWRRVRLVTPDGRTLIAQVHRPGDETWGEPQVVARAPRGSECIYIDPMPTYAWGEEDPFYANLRCRTRSAPDEPWTYVYPTAVTDDGTTWHSFLSTEGPVRVGRDMFFAGDPAHRWTPDGGLSEVALPVPRGGVTTLLPDGRYALSVLAPAPGGCRLVVRLSDPEGATWTDPVRSTARDLPAELCAFASVQGGDGRNVYHYLRRPLGAATASSPMVRLVWRDGEPVVEDGPN